MSKLCKIPSNSDIAGIGVRVAVYLQACLVVINSFVLETDPTGQARIPNLASSHDSLPIHLPVTVPLVEYSFDRFKSLLDPKITRAADRSLENTLFITGFALIISALIAAYSRIDKTGLTDYHALVVLNVSVLNYWAGYNLLRRRIRDDEQNLDPQTLLKLFQNFPQNLFRVENDRTDTTTEEQLQVETGHWRTIAARLSFYIHATALSGFGLWFWTHTSHFQLYTKDPVSKSQICPPPTVYWAFVPISLANRTLKIISIIFYSLFAIPVINGWATHALSCAIASLIACAITLVTLPIMVLFLVVGFFVQYLWILLSAPSSLDNENHCTLHRTLGGVSELLGYFRATHRRITTIVYTGPIIYWAVATEVLIRVNDTNLEDRDESEWSYGQVMALLAAIIAISFYIFQIMEDKSELIKREKRKQESEELEKEREGLKREMKGLETKVKELETMLGRRLNGQRIG